jgi:hypothetical protein
VVGGEKNWKTRCCDDIVCGNAVLMATGQNSCLWNPTRASKVKTNSPQETMRQKKGSEEGPIPRGGGKRNKSGIGSVQGKVLLSSCVL